LHKSYASASGYQVYFTSVRCYEENETTDDEIYAIFVACGWGPENAYVPWAKATYTKVFEDVEEETTYGSYDSSDNIRIWGNKKVYEAMDPDRSLILVQAMEEDNADRKVIKKALNEVMPARLRMLLAGNADRSTLVDKMKAQMKTTIDSTRCADANLVPDGLFDTVDDFANFPKTAVVEAADFLVGKELRDLLKLAIHDGLRDALAELDGMLDGQLPDAEGIINLIIDKLEAELRAYLYKKIKAEMGGDVADMAVNKVLPLIGDFAKEALDNGDGALQPSAGERWIDLQARLEDRLVSTMVNKMLYTITDAVMNAIPGVNIVNLVGTAIDIATDVLESILSLAEDCDDRVGYPKDLNIMKSTLSKALVSTQRRRRTFSDDGKYQYRFSIKGKALPIKDVQPVPSLSP
jgi:hypothetical protein